jgi:hypothetical protein
MFNPLQKENSYILISPEKKINTAQENAVNCERVCNILYSKDYTIFPVTGYWEGKFEKSFIAFPGSDNNDDLRLDALYLMDFFEQETVIVKYKGSEEATKINFDGSEKPLKFVLYDSDSTNKTYLMNGVSFSFVESKKYYFPKDKNDLKDGMLVEYFNNEKWNQRIIGSVDLEFERMYKLLIKYGKLRVEYN